MPAPLQPEEPLSMRLCGDGSSIQLTLYEREFPDMTDFWDGNWLVSEVSVETPHFSGRYRATVRADEILAFRDALHSMLEGRTKEAALATMEFCLELRGTWQPRGAVAWDVTARDDRDAMLRFDMETDHAAAVALSTALDRILARFPVIGSR